MANANDKVRDFVAQLSPSSNVCTIVAVANDIAKARIAEAKKRMQRGKQANNKKNGTWRVKGKTFGSIK